MIRQQRSCPDTCANPASGDVCSILELWDDSIPDVARVHTLDRFEKVCSRHAAMGLSGAVGYAEIVSENKRKNATWLMACTIKPALSEVPFGWSFDANGLLTINFASALSNSQKTTLQGQADIQFGAGKVKIV